MTLADAGHKKFSTFLGALYTAHRRVWISLSASLDLIPIKISYISYIARTTQQSSMQMRVACLISLSLFVPIRIPLCFIFKRVKL